MPQVPLQLRKREQVTLKIQSRQEQGKGPVGQMRRQHGLLPGVLYGHKQQPFSFKTEAHGLERLMQRGGQNALFLIEYEDGGRQPEQAIVREVQYHKVRGHVLHLDLLRIDPSETVRLVVPLITRGIPSGVRLGGGALQQTLAAVEMECVVSEMPSAIEIEVTDLEIGQSIHVGDLLEQEPRILNDPSVTVASVLAPRLVAEPTPAVAVEGEVVEGEEGAPAEEGQEPEEAQE
jgi:large subunit ribosomal protein L25